MTVTGGPTPPPGADERRPAAPRGSPRSRQRRRRAGLLAGGSFVAAMGAAFGLFVVYIVGGQTQVEGVLLAIALGGIGLGCVVWAQRLLPDRIQVEARHPLATSPGEHPELPPPSLGEAGLSRRRWLALALGGAVGTLLAALALPVFSLGPAPGRSLFHTAWRKGARLAPAGAPAVAGDSLPIDGVITVFPDGDSSDPNAATLLVRVDPALLAGSPDAAIAPDGYLAISKICTHAGCPVGLYRAAQHTLICPCHQSEFDVLHGARPINGPAARPLPRLPIQRQADGTFAALGDFPEPVGPSFWNVHDQGGAGAGTGPAGGAGAESAAGAGAAGAGAG